METARLTQTSDCEWRVEAFGRMRVPAIIYGDAGLIAGMDDKVFEQLTNVATLPGIVKAAYAMPDAHWGYGFPIGGVAAFDADDGGVVSAGGVGFDISCGVRAMLTNLSTSDLEVAKSELADALFATVPAGVGSKGDIRLTETTMEDMLVKGAEWAIRQGFGDKTDLERIEEHGCMEGADPTCISERARHRQIKEMGTLGSGNHYLEVQEVSEIFDDDAASAFGLRKGQVVVCIHCGSRGLGHQVGTEYLRDMAIAAPVHGIELPDRELACAPIKSDIGQRYLGAMRAATNCALANREIIGHLTRRVFDNLFPGSQLTLLYDVSHNTCKAERHEIDGAMKQVFIHRKGATRSLGPGHPDLPRELREIGQPVLIGGSMGTGSYVLVGVALSEQKAFSTACHGAGRQMSRHKARKIWQGRQVTDDLAAQGTIIRSPSSRGVAEVAPGAYKDVRAVVDSAETACLARKVARLSPLVCVKG
jgi:tRNA-splicing ligase RtcB